jgi:hypothetical protein
MSGSRSSPTNTTATTTNAKETNVSASNTSGVTVLGNKGPVSLTSISTDQGAVLAGVGSANAAVAANTGLAETVSTCSFSFANHALDVISAEQVNSASLVSNYLAQGSALLNQAESGIISVASSAAAAENTQLANTAETLANIAQANDTSQAAQETKFTQTILLAGIAAVVLVIILSHKG